MSQSDDPGLPRVVTHVVGKRHDRTGQRRHHDDAAVTARHHVLQCFPGGIERRGQVALECGLPVGVRQLVAGACRIALRHARHACVVHEYVDTTYTCNRFPNQLRRAFGNRQVAHKTVSVDATGPKLVDPIMNSFARRGDDDFSASVAEHARGGEANARGRSTAGDDGGGRHELAGSRSASPAPKAIGERMFSTVPL
jgi:hypothetical protein